MKLEKDSMLLIGSVVAIAIIYVYMRGVGGVAKDAAAALVSAGGGVVAGAAEGIGSQIGIPVTNTDQCSIDLAAGNYWKASFSCPAGRLIGLQ